MRIERYSVAMAAQHYLLESDRQEDTIRYWTDPVRPSQVRRVTPPAPGGRLVDIAEISGAGKKKLASSNGAGGESIVIEPSQEDKQKILLLRAMIASLTGKTVRFFLPEKVVLKEQKAILTLGRNFLAPLGDSRTGWGLAIDFRQSHYERESLSFTARGTATIDGKQVDFTIQLFTSREFFMERSLQFRAGDAAKTDPLVISLDRQVPGLTGQKFNFDLNIDGKAEQIHLPVQGSGFLALDRNQDGLINDGSELFGPRTGNGFQELAQYDFDGNSWIDEDDPVFDRLRIWIGEPGSGNTLPALGQAGIGAVFLGHIDSPFTLKDAENQFQGQIRASGIFLKEDGSAGVIQEVDLAV